MQTKHGFFLLNKPSGPSSAKAIYPIKKLSYVEKLGHAGTLDPLASGLLVVGINKATRLLGYAQAGIKRYSGTFKLGITTDTYDCMGRVLEEKTVTVDSGVVTNLSSSFMGEQMQQPPIYSALKIRGLPSYKRARMGEEVTLAPRKITIYNFKIKEVDKNLYSFHCECSTGTYIRSIVSDIGTKLKTGACLMSLQRDASLPFTLEQATTLEKIEEQCLMPWWEVIKSQRIAFSEKEILDLQCGRQEFLKDISKKINAESSMSELLLYTNQEGNPIGLLKWVGEKYELLLHIE